MTKTEKIKKFLANPNKDNFDAIRRDALALELIYDKLKDKEILFQFFETYEDWSFIFYNSSRNHPWSRRAWQSMKKEAKKFEHKVQIWFRSEEGEEKKLALKDVLTAAKTYEHWDIVHSNTVGETKKLARQNMSELAEGLDQLITVYRCSAYKCSAGEMKDSMKKRMSVLELPIETWVNNYNKYKDVDEELAILFLEKIAEKAKTLVILKLVYSGSTGEMKADAEKKIRKLDMHLETLVLAYLDATGDFKKLMLSMIKSFKDLPFETLKKYHSDTTEQKLKDYWLKRMFKKAEDADHWEYLYSVSKHKPKKRAKAFKEMSKLI